MSFLNEPSIQQIILDKIILKRLKNLTEYEKDFIDSITNAIEKDYDEISREFAENLIRIDREGFDEFGFFSLGKDIWVILDKDEKSLLGYEVITRKRGGCIKMGPTYLKPYARGKGYTIHAIEGLIDVYKSVGARKVYVTAPLNHPATALLDFRDLKMNLEAILHNHYSSKSSERVCGRFIEEYDHNFSISSSVIYGSKKIQDILINNLENYSKENFTEFIIQNMSYDYDDIDDNFVNNILTGVDRGIDATYEKKGKLVVNFFSDASLEGMAVLTLKRGGVLKVIPFFLKRDFVSFENVEKILTVIERQAEKYKRRKITFFISIRSINIMNILSYNQYICEGIIREPYKRGIDMIILSKFLL